MPQDLAPETHSEPLHKKRRIQEDKGVKQVDRATLEGRPAEIMGKKKLARRGTRSSNAQTRRHQKYVNSGCPERARKVIDSLTGMKSHAGRG